MAATNPPLLHAFWWRAELIDGSLLGPDLHTTATHTTFPWSPKITLPLSATEFLVQFLCNIPSPALQGERSWASTIVQTSKQTLHSYISQPKGTREAARDWAPCTTKRWASDPPCKDEREGGICQSGSNNRSFLSNSFCLLLWPMSNLTEHKKQ